MSEQQQTGLRARVQRFGSFLSGMIMPNIGAFIAWGLITALLRSRVISILLFMEV